MNYQAYFEGKIQDRKTIHLPDNEIQQLVEQDLIVSYPGVKVITPSRFSMLKSPIFQCMRCQSTDPKMFATHYCLYCAKNCTYCRHCLSMGKVAQCTQLLRWKGTLSPIQDTPLFTWQGSYSTDQRRAVDEWIVSCNQGKSHLVNAVCGAGKTEIMFGAIQHLLTLNKRIAVACPRTDVILELEPRFQDAFTNCRIDSLYGGSEKPLGLGTITLATTHQLYRFHEAFDVVIIDEADAFPYSADQTLVKAVKKSLKSDGVIHMISATPTKNLLFDTETVLPRRFHQHPLPVPRYEKLLTYEKSLKNKKIPPKLANWISKQIESNCPFLVFFPSVRMLEEFPGDLKRVHAEHPMRKNYVQLLRDGKIPGLLTTTILERGITIRNLQVAVVGAEQAIFTKEALIQIAGRVGRAADAPTGDVVFFHRGVTEEMHRAKKEIEKLNAL